MSPFIILCSACSYSSNILSIAPSILLKVTLDFYWCCSISYPTSNSSSFIQIIYFSTCQPNCVFLALVFLSKLLLFLPFISVVFYFLVGIYEMTLIKYKGSRKKYNQKNLPNMEPIPFLIVWTAIVLMGGSSAEKLKYSVFALLKLCFRSAVFLTSVSLALIHESLTGSIWFEIMLTVAWYFSMIISLFVFSYLASVLSISLSWVDIVVVMLLGEQGFLSSKIYSIISSPKILWRSPLNSRRLALTLALAETISGVLHSQVDT